MPRKPADTFPCPNCGADVPARSRVCKECGADDETGWSEETLYDGLDLPDQDEDGIEAPRPAAKSRAGRITAAIVLVALLLMALGVASFVVMIARSWTNITTGR